MILPISASRVNGKSFLYKLPNLGYFVTVTENELEYDMLNFEKNDFEMKIPQKLANLCIIVNVSLNLCHRST
jgi:hypothetical protein